MELLSLVIALIVVGVAVSIVPMDATMKRGIILIVLLVAALFVLRAFLGPIPLTR